MWSLVCGFISPFRCFISLLMTQRAEEPLNALASLIIPKRRKSRKQFFYRANVFFLKRGWKREKNRSPSLSNFLRCHNEYASKKKLIFLLSTIFFIKKAQRKNYELLLPLPAFFPPAPNSVSREKTENITMSGKKFSACAIQSQKNFCRFSFSKKKQAHQRTEAL